MTRRGLTLIELLVVVGLFTVLATLTVALVPGLQRRQRVALGAERLQGWLLVARQLALRDRVPTGVRLEPAADDPHRVTALSYVQQPDDFCGGPGSTVSIGWPPGTTPADQVTANGVDFAGGFAGQSLELWPVQTGDYLEVQGGGWMRQIVSVSPSRLQLAGAPPQPVPPTSQYRIVRRPRGLPGEAALQLPDDVAVDLSLSLGIAADGRTGATDVLFSPPGQVVGSPSGQIILWLFDSSPGAMPEAALLVSIHTRTGFIATHPVDISGSDPYRFTRDGRSSGS